MVAQPNLDGLEAQLPPDDFGAAKQSAATAELEELVSAVRQDFARFASMATGQAREQSRPSVLASFANTLQTSRT